MAKQTRMSAAQYQKTFGPKYKPGLSLSVRIGPKRAPLERTSAHESLTASQRVFVNFTGKVPSINSCYVNVRGKGRILNAKGREFKKAVTWRIKDRLTAAPYYTLQVAFSLPLKYKNGKRRKWDVTNHVKLLEDAMCAALGIDDSQILRVFASKTEGAWGFTASIETATENNLTS